MQRPKDKEKRKRWNEAVDKYISTIRNSLAVSSGRSRKSSFSFGAILPSSQYVANGDGAGNAAGIGIHATCRS